MKKYIKIYNGTAIANYTETEAKKQALWDALIAWRKEHNAFYGEDYQSDDFQIDAGVFIANTIDEIIKFEVEGE